MAQSEPAGGLALGRKFERHERQRGRTGKLARQEEPAGRQEAERVPVVAAGMQVGGEHPRSLDRDVLVGRRKRIDRYEPGMPGRGVRTARGFARLPERLRRPGLIALVEQRQVQQPFAGVVDDVERQRAHCAARGLIVDDNAKLADLARRFRPLAILHQRAHVALVVEARHRVVGLRRQAGAGDASARKRLEHRKAAAAQQAMHQRGDEHCLAGARKAGDAEPHGRAEQPAAEFGERERREPGLFDEV